MRILFVGGAGYIGGYATSLLQKYWDVTVYDNLLYETRFLKSVNFIRGDIRDTQKLVNAAKDHDVIVFAAALVGDPACSVDQALTEELNYTAVKRFCEQMPKNKHLIFLSTCSVYGAQDGILDEESPTNPLSSYASTKLRAEKHVLDVGGTIFRLGTVYGVGDNYSRIRLDLVLNVLTFKAVTEGTITVNGGEQWRPIISVKDIAGYIREACINRKTGIFVLAHSNTTISELGNVVSKRVPGTEIVITELSFQDARNYRVSNKKALTEFEYRPVYSPEIEVDEMGTLIKSERIVNPFDDVYNNGKFIAKLHNAK